MPALQEADGVVPRGDTGAGRGLAIARSLCEGLGYRLQLSSQVGAGSTFTILLTPPAAVA